ncbi:hypothetical protein [Actinopolyspora halophila]|uniref:hypothetical protein n=1 Tax=Actinopolyspora halophila TaxID=1850 RepID=UPI0012F88DF4|nr:hypothetical protein [Actinopolyspora halophila]
MTVRKTRCCHQWTVFCRVCGDTIHTTSTVARAVHVAADLAGEHDNDELPEPTQDQP